MKKHIRALLIICLSLIGILLVPVSRAQTYQLVYSFIKSPANPEGNLVQGPDGSFYGTTFEGGAKDSGTIFKIDASNNISILYSFTGKNDGANPFAGLTFGADGNLYGTTYAGGTKKFGTIFQISTNGAFTSLVSFTGTGAALGRRPQGAMISATDGNLYGTTIIGGANNSGIVFRVTTNGVFTPLISFSGADGMGSQPYGGLVQGPDGNLYGTTYNGGSNSVGTVFVVTTNGSLTTLFSFGITNGSNPYVGLTFGPDGNLYGTTYNGGSSDSGTIFRFATNGSLTTLYSFANDTSGGNPRSTLVVGTNGVLYGTCSGGGNGQGTLFSITTNGVFTSLYAFNGFQDGGLPYAGLICGHDGNLYGLNYSSGDNNQGTFYEYNLAVPNTISMLVPFANSLPLIPFGSLVPGPNGTFYGTSQAGGISNVGTIYQLNPAGSVTVLHSFTGNDGANPYATLTLAPDGNYYGTTAGGGSNTFGTIFRFATNGVFTSLYSFTDFPSGVPESGLTVAPDGLLYGTFRGSTGGVYRMDTNGHYTMLTNFANADTTIGFGAQANLTVAPDGNLYGVNPNGGTNSWGTIFRVSTNGSVTLVLSFTGLGGANPGGGTYENLLVGPDGLLYGTSSQGGTNDYGTVYSVTTNGIMNVIYYFNGDTNGSYPQSGLIIGPGGNFYGATASSGAHGQGTLYMLTTNGILTTLYSFTGGNDGSAPPNHLVLAADHNLYGNAYGGVGGAGVIYRLSVAPTITTNLVAQNLVISNTANLIVAATNSLFTDPLTYQWYFNGTPILNATNATYSFGPVLTNATGSRYQVVVTGAGGSVTSSIAPVTVWIPSILNLTSDQNRQVMALTLSSAPGSTNRVLTSTNLLTAMAQWQPFSTNIPGTNGLFQVIDTNNNLPGSTKFYRLSSP